MKVASLWSGGKDSSLATYEAAVKGFKVSHLISYTYNGAGDAGSGGALKRPLSVIYDHVGRASPSIVNNLLSFVYNKDLSRMIPHEVAPEIIAGQAKAMHLPLIHGEVKWDTLDEFLKSNLRKLKQTGVEGLVFGVVPPHYPIDSSEKLREHRTLVAHKEWMNHICHKLGITPITPLWESNPEQILRKIVAEGFETIIVVVDSKYFGKEWLGRKIDADFIDEVHRLNHEKSVHIAGSGYHTLVTDCPLFKKRLKIIRSRKIWKSGYGVLEISGFELAKKESIQKKANL
jgi:diphthine-ammonia ligase